MRPYRPTRPAAKPGEPRLMTTPNNARSGHSVPIARIYIAEAGAVDDAIVLGGLAEADQSRGEDLGGGRAVLVAQPLAAECAGECEEAVADHGSAALACARIVALAGD